MLSYALRRILLDLWEYNGAPKLDKCVRRFQAFRPRNVTANRLEIDAILDAVKPSVRLWLLFCSDMAIRSGTAAKLNGDNYNAVEETMEFTTKGQKKATLPVTAEIADILAKLDHGSNVPYVWQLRAKEQCSGRKATSFDITALRREWRAAIKKLGLKRLVPHDLRRTAAMHMLEETHDIRAVQALLTHIDLKSTLWYLDHNATPVDRSVLELIKRPAWARKEKIA
jgi:integrase